MRIEAIPDFKSALRCESFLEPHSDGNRSVPEPEYDAIIGGPAFVRLEGLHRSQKERLRYYRQRFLSAQRSRFDLYMLFIEQALDLLKPGGLLAFSLSNSFLRSEGGRRICGYIAANASVEEVVEFDDPRTYADAATQIALLRLRKTRAACGGRHALVRGRGGLRRKLEHLVSDCPHPDTAITPLEDGATHSSCWRMTDPKEERWLESILQAGIPLGRLVTAEHGLSTGRGEILLLRKVQARCSEILARRREELNATRFESAAMRSVIRGHQLKKYGQVGLPNLYPFPFDDIRGKLLSEAALRAIYPLTCQYLLSHREALSRRHLAKGCPWYSTFVRLPAKSSNGGRLMSSTITSGRGFVLIDDPKLLAHNSVVVLAPVDDRVDLYFLFGVLNSNVFSRYIALTMPRISAGRFSLRLSALRRFPVPARPTGSSDGACRQIALLARKLLGIPMGTALDQIYATQLMPRLRSYTLRFFLVVERRLASEGPIHGCAAIPQNSRCRSQYVDCESDCHRKRVPGQDHALQIGVSRCQVVTIGAIVLQRQCSSAHPWQKSQGQLSSAVAAKSPSGSNPLPSAFF